MNISSDTDPRTSPELLVEAIAEDFRVYIGRGISLDSVLSDIEPNLNIEGLDDLLDVHFVLSGKQLAAEAERRPPGLDVGVMDFLSLLPRRLRRLRTTTTKETHVFDGEVRGRIDWSQTIKTRYRSGNPDSLQFACELTEESIATSENLVLWELLRTIKSASDQARDLVGNSDQHEWFEPWLGDSQLQSHLDTGLANIHLAELSELGYSITDRMLQNVRSSRTTLYREAAELLSWYRRLQNHELDQSDARELLRRQMFYPDPEREDYDETPTLFELYWIFRLLNAYDKPRLKLITTSSDLVAAWEEGEYQYELYHDWTGSDELSFKPPVFDREELLRTNSTDDRYLRRLDHLLSTRTTAAKAAFDLSRPVEPSETRPDFVLIKRVRESDIIDSLALGEVKYTRNISTAANGLEELLEYLIYCREVRSKQTVRYLTRGPDHYSSSNVRGLLCLDAVEHSSPGTSCVEILEFGDEISRPI